MKVRHPHIDTRYTVATHGPQNPRRIVLHSTESDPRGVEGVQTIARFWQAQGQGLGAHYILLSDRTLGKGADVDEVTWAVAGHNTGSVHIELGAYASWSRAKWLRHPRMLHRCARLIASIATHNDMPLKHDTDHGVCRHMDFHNTGADHTDPGKGAPFGLLLRWARLLARGGKP